MGVKGLWKLLEPTGRPVTLESLENKVLGVDTSLLLNQSVKGIRDKEGNAVPNAHLVGLFHRVCKLLFYRIKPVFVFDGGVPHLKKQTLAERRERKMKAMHGSSKAAERIIKNYLKGKALETVTGKKSCTTMQRAGPREPDLFDLPPLSEGTTSQESSSDEDVDGLKMEQIQLQSLEAEFTNPSGINVESEDFKALTPEIQHELIMDMKQERKYINVTAMPQVASSFSDFQLEGVLKRGRLNLRLDELRKEMANRNTGQVSGLASQDSQLEECTVKSQRIASEDTGHYILIKSGEQKQPQEEHEDSQVDSPMDGGFIPDSTDYQILSRKPKPSKQNLPTSPPSFEISDTDSSDEENAADRLQVDQLTVKDTENQETQRQNVEETTRSDDGTEEKEQMERRNTEASQENAKQKDDDVVSNAITGEIESVTETSGPYMTTEQPASQQNEVKERQPDARILSGAVLSGNVSDKKESVDQTKKQKERKEILIDLTVGPTDNDDKVVLSGEDGRVPPASGNHKGALIDLTDEDDDSVLPFIAIINQEGREAQLSGNRVSAGGGKLLIDLTRDDASNPNSTEERTAEDCQKPPRGETDCGEVLCLDSTSAIADFIGSTKMVAPGDKDPARGNLRTMDNGSVVEESVGTSSVAKDDSPIASTSGTQGIGDGEESGGPSEAGTVPRDQDNEVASLTPLTGGAPLEREENVPESAGVIPQEWHGATKEDLEVIQLDLGTEQRQLEEEQARQNRIAATVSSDMLTESQELLRLFGVPFIVSPMEAEAQCAALDLTDQTDGSITDDSDVFLFGGRKVYRNIFNQTKHAELYRSDTVQRSLGMDRSKLISLAYFTGSDYTEGIPGIGVVGAMEVLLEFPGDGLEGLKQFKKWHEAAQQQEKPVQETMVKKKLRSLVLSKGFPSEQVHDAYANPVVNNSTEKFEWGKPDLHGLRLFALDKLGWSRSKTDEILLPVLKELNKKETQLKLDTFFQVQFEETKKIQSKRIRRVVNRFSHPSTSQNNEKRDEDKDEEKNVPTQEKKKGKKTRKKTPKSQDVEKQNSEQSLGKRESVEHEDARMVGLNEEIQKQGCRTQKRNLDKLDIAMEQSPAKRTRSTTCSHSETESRQDGARRTRSVRGRGPTRGGVAAPRTKSRSESSTPPDDTKISDRVGSSPQTGKLTPGRAMKQNDSSSRGPARGRARGSGANKRLLETSTVDEQDSTSSDSESGDDNRYIGPQPASVLRRGRSRGRPRKNLGRGRGAVKARVTSDVGGAGNL